MTVAGAAALALLLAACGATAPASSSAHPRLTCVTVIAGGSIDVVTAHLTCQVSGAAASDTSFSLQYRVTDDSGQSRTLADACVGALHNGAGSCSRAYSAPVPLSLTPATVSGYTSPGHQALGPVTPTVVTATLAPGQHL